MIIYNIFYIVHLVNGSRNKLLPKVHLLDVAMSTNNFLEKVIELWAIKTVAKDGDLAATVSWLVWLGHKSVSLIELAIKSLRLP